MVSQVLKTAPSNLILGIDFGSTHACSRLYTHKLHEVGSHTIPLTDCTNLDPEEAWLNLCELIEGVLRDAGVNYLSVMCLGLSVQRNSFLLWDRRTSKPLTGISSWQDTTSADYTAEKNQSSFIKFLNASGRMLYPVVQAQKLKLFATFRLKNACACMRLSYLLQNDPLLAQRCHNGEVMYGCLETWLLWRLTGKETWATDVSCSSATGVYDPFAVGWSSTLLQFLKIPKEILPNVYPTSHNFGLVRCGPLAQANNSKEEKGGHVVRVTAIIGDAQAATLGEGCLSPGDAKLTLGTGGFLNINTGSKAIARGKGFYPLIGWSAMDIRRPSHFGVNTFASFPSITYLLEGFNSEAGTAVEALRRLGLFQSFEEAEDLLVTASREEWNRSPSMYVPSSIGLQQPVSQSDNSVKGTRLKRSLTFVNTNCLIEGGGVFVGLPELPTNVPARLLPPALRAELLHAAFESIAMSAKLMIEHALSKSKSSRSYIPIKELRVNGNLSNSNWLMQRLADLLRFPIERSSISETSCLGAGIAAGVGAGIWANYESAEKVLRAQTHRRHVDSSDGQQPNARGRRFQPQQSTADRIEPRYAEWLQICRMVAEHRQPLPGGALSDPTDKGRRIISLSSLSRALSV